MVAELGSVQVAQVCRREENVGVPRERAES